MLYTQILRLLTGAISGILFGSGMIISGMVDPNKVIAFLDIFGEWDPSLAFVMGGALLVFTPIYHFQIKPRKQAINGDAFAYTNNQKVDRKLLLGATIFGAGWGLAGFCPGPVVSSIAGGSEVILTFMLSLLVGMVIANQYLAGRFRFVSPYQTVDPQ